jgi:2-oxoisovalerate dehydrogenase E1 component
MSTHHAKQENSDTAIQRLLDGYRQMQRIRRVEETVARRYGEWKMRCPVHLCIGEEAIAVGVSLALRRSDLVYSNHRAHGHYLAKGGDLSALIAEFHGKASGCAGGWGGSMHLIDIRAGFMGSTPIVGGTVPVAAGAAWANRLQAGDKVTVVYFGDGCFEEGVVHETMNFAALHRLPIVFVCENNDYSVYTHRRERQPDRPISVIAAAHGLAATTVDGNDVEAVFQAAQTAVDAARRGDGPQFIEAFTHRWLEHCGPNDDDDLAYRQSGELARWLERCPVTAAASRLDELGVGRHTLRGIDDQIQTEINAAFASAESAAPPSNTVQAERNDSLPGDGAMAVTNRMLTYAEAVAEGLRQSMDADPNVIVIGEGVPDPKGIFGTTRGLRERFGDDRVFDSPLSENGITGICIGAALNGMRPVMVHQRIDFALLAMDQLVNNAAKWRHMFNGQQSVPLVIRVILGRGWGQGPQHGQSLHAMFAHVPGLKVVMPTTPRDAKGMLIAAIEDDDPVLFIEHRWLHKVTGRVSEPAFRTPLVGANCIHHGDHVTIAAFSHMSIEALKAAEWLAQQGVCADVLDMRSLSPMDTRAVVDSVARTGHLVVADTGHQGFGAAQALVADVCMQALQALNKPPAIVALPDAPLPTSRFLADHYYPDAASIAIAAFEQLGIPSHEAQAVSALRRAEPRDQPDPDFTGPF